VAWQWVVQVVQYTRAPEGQRHGRSLSGARVAKPAMMILLGARGAKPHMHGNVSIFEYPGFCIQS